MVERFEKRAVTREGGEGGREGRREGGREGRRGREMKRGRMY